MKHMIVICAIAGLFLPAALVLADHTDNQIEEEPKPMRAPIRQIQPRRQMVKNCRSCGPNECQVMGMQRFSEPRCEARGGLGAPCRIWQEPENKTLHFPNGILKCNQVYMQLCPCKAGLVCDKAECRRPKHGAARRGAAEREERGSFDGGLEEQEEEDDEMPVALEPNRSKFPWAVARFH